MVYAEQRAVLLQKMDEAHLRFSSWNGFRGPSLHFHLGALAAAQQGPDAFAAQAYALLASWGMHRMGPGGSKMGDFEPFRRSMHEMWPRVSALQATSPAAFKDPDWQALEEIFLGLNCMESSPILVAHSKVMAHCLPELVAPVDRRYTLRFLGHSSVPSGKGAQWLRLRGMLEHLFHPILRSDEFRTQLGAWRAADRLTAWDTSPMKTLDNIVIGAGRAD